MKRLAISLAFLAATTACGGTTPTASFDGDAAPGGPFGSGAGGRSSVSVGGQQGSGTGGRIETTDLDGQHGSGSGGRGETVTTAEGPLGSGTGSVYDGGQVGSSCGK